RREEHETDLISPRLQRRLQGVESAQSADFDARSHDARLLPPNSSYRKARPRLRTWMAAVDPSGETGPNLCGLRVGGPRFRYEERARRHQDVARYAAI